MKHTPECIPDLRALGITYDDALALRHISMTLHRWYELECGDSNDYQSWAIVRGRQTKDFEYAEEGLPYLEHHPRQGSTWYQRIPDRERGAVRRLNKIMTRYPALHYYLQTDPRGASLYIGSEILDQCSYLSKGKAVYK